MTLRKDADDFLYFAYGSNMSVSKLTAPTRAPSARLICSGYVTGRRLTFDKASKDSSGKCDCELTVNSDDRVYGVVPLTDRPWTEQKVIGMGTTRRKSWSTHQRARYPH